MYVPIILFFTSFLSIMVMIGRKLLTRDEIQEVTYEEKISFEIPYLEEVKDKTTHNVKKYGYATLVITLRAYFRSVNFLKSNYGQIKNKVQDRFKKENNVNEKREASGFLKVITEYKGKIKEIKHRIRNEENL